jgi:predicted HTH transcriptional regulator
MTHTIESLPSDLEEIIYNRREKRNIEYKDSMSWKDKNVRVRITRSILGMANLPSGGYIVFGVRQNGNEFVPSGMDLEHSESFTQDNVDDFVRNYAEPFVEVSVTRYLHREKIYVIIQVNGFEELPVICKKDEKLKDGSIYLKQGLIYTRSRSKVETTEVRTQTEMREIIEQAVDKSLHKFIDRMGRAGILSLISAEPSSDDRFDEQLREMI